MAERSMYGFGPPALPRELNGAKLVLTLRPGERAMAVKDAGFVVAHPDHAPWFITWADGAMFCERIDV